MSTELDALVGKTVKIIIAPGPVTFGDVQGRLVAYNASSLAVDTRDGPLVVDLIEVDDIHEIEQITKITRRLLRYIPISQARQHLADRHSVPWSVVKAMTPEVAVLVHGRMDHTDLGHRHRDPSEEK